MIVDAYVVRVALSLHVLGPQAHVEEASLGPILVGLELVCRHDQRRPFLGGVADTGRLGCQLGGDQEAEREEGHPEQPMTTWAYDPPLDPVLEFDSARARSETLIDDALASGEAGAMRAALEELQRQSAPYLQWSGKAERTSFEIDPPGVLTSTGTEIA